ncbi:MAG: glycosyltransferase family 2 protein [Anaerolineales bacterium]|nr:glycosyltransferase family 2 protein [Anaerolineales bacterium]
MSDLISVVIPVHNVSRFIDAAIASVLNQTYRNFEIIVVDDCSTDETADILLNHRETIRFIRHDTNQGAAAARNTGVEMARGDLVAFLDGDDKWHPEKLEIFAESFSRHPDVLFGFSDFSRFKWSDGSFFALSNSQIFPVIYGILHRFKYSGRKSFVIPGSDMFRILLEGYPIYPSAMVVRKRLFDRIGMWRKVQTNEDFDIGLRSSMRTDCLYIDENLAMIGRHDANLTVDTHRQMEGDILVFDLHLADTGYSNEEKGLIRHYRGKRLCGIGHSYLRSGEKKRAFRMYVEALRNGGWTWHAISRIGYIAVTGPFLPKISSRTTSR